MGRSPVGGKTVGPSRGHTLVEIVVALFILSVGVLGLVGSTILAARWMSESTVRLRATARLRTRMEAITRTVEAGRLPCESPLAGGTATGPGGLEERWTIGQSRRRRVITVLVDYPIPAGRRADTLYTILPCP